MSAKSGRAAARPAIPVDGRRASHGSAADDRALQRTQRRPGSVWRPCPATPAIARQSRRHRIRASTHVWPQRPPDRAAQQRPPDRFGWPRLASEAKRSPASRSGPDSAFSRICDRPLTFAVLEKSCRQRRRPGRAAMAPGHAGTRRAAPGTRCRGAHRPRVAPPPARRREGLGAGRASPPPQHNRRRRGLPSNPCRRHDVRSQLRSRTTRRPKDWQPGQCTGRTPGTGPAAGDRADADTASHTEADVLADKDSIFLQGLAVPAQKAAVLPGRVPANAGATQLRAQPGQPDRHLRPQLT
ncbi:hypothetical protein ACVILL_007569 [Bradyrhizobium sp. USDA 3364]